MELWIPITIAAAFLQNIRSALQRHLKDRLGVSGATLVRFLYGIPAAGLIVAVLHVQAGHALPSLGARFVLWVTLASLAQITAQALLIMAFGFRNFTVATAYSRTEPVHAALFGFLALGERPEPRDGAAILLAVAGVALISVARDALSLPSLARALVSRGALTGLASGAVFGVAAVAYRAASLSLEPAGGVEPGFLMRASVTLLSAVLIQSALLIAYMALRRRDDLRAVFLHWRPGALVGTVGATASFLWFAAMTLQQAAVVKGLAQIEMLFTYAASVFVFKEQVTRREIAGCLLIIGGVALLML